MILRQYLIILAIFVKQKIVTTEKSKKIAENKQKKYETKQEFICYQK